MDIRKIEPRDSDESQPPLKPEKTRRSSRSRREKDPSPLSGLLAIGVIIGIGILFVFSTLTNPQPQVKGTQDKKETVKNSRDAKEASAAIKNRVDDRLESIKDQVEGLTEEDFVVESPQVQKLITDLQALQGLPAGEARDVCESICQSIK